MTRTSQTDEASTMLLLEWVEKLFNERIGSIKELALFLIEKMYVNTNSAAAMTLLQSAKTEIKPAATITHQQQQDQQTKSTNPNVQFDSESESGKRKQMVCSQEYRFIGFI